MNFVKDILSSVERLLFSGGVGSALQAITKASSSNFQPGDIDLNAVTLVSEDGQRTYDLLAQCASFEVFENITSPVIFGELTILDSVGLLDSFPIIGEEYVSISFNTPRTQGKPASYTFRVRGVVNKQVNESNKNVTYTLLLSSNEYRRNNVRLVNKAFEKNISDIVREILTEDLQTDKPIRIEKTSGIQKVTLTNMPPMKAIDYLRNPQWCASTEFSGSPFVFFESRDGYVFTPIFKLIADGRKVLQASGTDKEFFFDTQRKDNIKDVNYRTIISYNLLSRGSGDDILAGGGITNEVITFDLVSSNYKKVTYTNNLGADKQQSPGGGASQRSSNFNREHGKTTAVRQFMFTRADKENINPENYSTVMAAALNATSLIANIQVYGDSELRVGDVIRCIIPSSTSIDDGKSESRLESGNYFVSALRHMVVGIASDRPQHTISLELLKSDFGDVK